MGRKSTKNTNKDKGKEKKLKRKEENAKLAASQAKVVAANKLANPMDSFTVFKKYERNGLCLSIECNRVTDLEESVIDWAFQLTKSNMEVLYEESEWGWKDKDKREEMIDDKAWYIIVRDEGYKPVGFVHFQFDMEYDEEVLYCYEIQIEKHYRNKGLGKFLMQILQLMANKTEMLKVVLTAFKHNKDGFDFFTKVMGFQVDETSPEASLYEESYTYVILSKLTKVGKEAMAILEAQERLEPLSQCTSACGKCC